MVVTFAVQARKKPKLTRFMDVGDFQMILFTGMVLPFCIWFFFGIGFDRTFIFVVAYILWMWKFKMGKPDGYWKHWLSFQFRGKRWGCHTGNPPKPIFRDLRL